MWISFFLLNFRIVSIQYKRVSFTSLRVELTNSIIQVGSSGRMDPYGFCGHPPGRPPDKRTPRSGDPFLRKKSVSVCLLVPIVQSYYETLRPSDVSPSRGFCPITEFRRGRDIEKLSFLVIVPSHDNFVQPYLRVIMR